MIGNGMTSERQPFSVHEMRCAIKNVKEIKL